MVREEGRTRAADLDAERAIVSREGASETKVSDLDASLPDEKVLRLEVAMRVEARRGRGGGRGRGGTDA
jgi:hypothetical protein